MYNQSRLIELVKQQALKTGEFKLASGKTASYYLDCRRLTLHGEGANLIAAGMLDLMADNLPDTVGGMAIGADPITASLITISHQRGQSLLGFIVRKEAKEHGMGRLVEGPVEPGQTAVIVEDVVTTGGSCLAAVQRARDFGLQVDRAFAIVDRMEGAAEKFSDIDVQFQSLLNIEMLGLTPPAA